MTHGEVRTLLGAYLEGELPLDRRALLDAHFDACEPCARRLRELRHTVDVLRGLGDPEPPPFLVERVMARIEAGQGRPGPVARLLARLPGPLQGRLALPAVALASAVVLFVWMQAPPGPAPAPLPELGEAQQIVRDLIAGAGTGAGASAISDEDPDPTVLAARLLALPEPQRREALEMLRRTASPEARRALADALSQRDEPAAQAMARALAADPAP